MTNFREEHDKALARLTGRKDAPAPEFKVTQVDIPLEIDNLTPEQLAMRRIANLGVSLGTSKGTLMTQTPLETEAATHLWNSVPPDLKSELKLTLHFREDGKVQFVMKSNAYVQKCLDEFDNGVPKPASGGHSR